MFSRVVSSDLLKAEVDEGSHFLPHDMKAWLETAVLVLALPLLMMGLNNQDPFLLQTGFPWIVLPLLLVAFRYGTLVAMGGLVLLFVGVVTHWQMQDISPTASHWQSLGGISIMTLLAAELFAKWQRRFHQEQNNRQDLQTDMQQVERELQVLQVSHIQLEKELLDAGQSLKKSLGLVEEGLPQDLPASRQREWLADRMMSILSSYDWLEVAAFFVMDKAGQLKSRPLVQTGGLVDLPSDDLLLQEVLRVRKPVSLPANAYFEGKHDTDLVAAIPVLDRTGKVRLVLAVQHVQFAAYKQQNFNLLAALCAWLGGRLPVSGLQKRTKPASSGALIAEQIDTVLRLWAGRKMSAVLLSAAIPADDQGRQYAKYFATLQQGSNMVWHLRQQDTLVVIVALPLATQEQAEQFQQKVEDTFQDRFGKRFDQAGINLHRSHFSQYHPRQLQAHLKEAV